MVFTTTMTGWDSGICNIEQIIASFSTSDYFHLSTFYSELRISDLNRESSG